MTPIHEHDCDECTYLGTEAVEDDTYDFYFCPNGPTVIARYGIDGEYLSGIYYVGSAVLNRAVELAREQGVWTQEASLIRNRYLNEQLL